MYQDRIVLTSRDILEKEFKIDTRGYRPQEVDRYLDVIIKDYEEMKSIINELEKRIEEGIEDNKKEYSLKSQMAVFVLRDILELIEDLKDEKYDRKCFSYLIIDKDYVKSLLEYETS